MKRRNKINFDVPISFMWSFKTLELPSNHHTFRVVICYCRTFIRLSSGAESRDHSANSTTVTALENNCFFEKA